jgi:acyl carrier protein
MEIPPKLEKYIDTNRGSLPPITDPDEPLQIDSLDLIEFLETEFGYQIENEELIAENFATLRKLGPAPVKTPRTDVQEGRYRCPNDPADAPIGLNRPRVAAWLRQSVESFKANRNDGPQFLLLVRSDLLRT